MDFLSGGPLVIGGTNLLVLKSFHHMPSDSPRHSGTSSPTCSTCSRVVSHPITAVSPSPLSLMINPLLRLLPPIPGLHVTRPYVWATVTFHLTPKWPVVHLLQDNIPVILLTCLRAQPTPVLNKTTVFLLHSLFVHRTRIFTSYASIVFPSPSSTVSRPH
jgi:hypothetical protein